MPAFCIDMRSLHPKPADKQQGAAGELTCSVHCGIQNVVAYFVSVVAPSAGLATQDISDKLKLLTKLLKFYDGACPMCGFLHSTIRMALLTHCCVSSAVHEPSWASAQQPALTSKVRISMLKMMPYRMIMTCPHTSRKASCCSPCSKSCKPSQETIVSSCIKRTKCL